MIIADYRVTGYRELCDMLMIQWEGGESEIGLLPKELRSAFAAIEIGL